MPAAGREAVLREFRAAPRAVIANAKCLTEGVACGVGFRMVRGAKPSPNRRSGCDKS